MIPITWASYRGLAMAKIVYRDKQKSVFLSQAETVLLLAAEFGTAILDAFFPAKYPETRLTRRLLGLDTLSRERFRVARYRLIRQGLVAKRTNTYALTPAGKKVIGTLQRMLSGRPPAWDGQWRIVVFDIPEVRKQYREALRRELAAADYQRLQDSVWIGKHPLPDDVATFIEECNLGACVYIFLSSTVDREEAVARLFRKEGATSAR